MKKFMILSVVILLNNNHFSSLKAQGLNFNFGESYESILSKLKEDRKNETFGLFIDIIQSENEIIRIFDPQGTEYWEELKGLRMAIEYFFADNKLTKQVIITDPGNADKMLAFWYKIRTEDLGEPKIIRSNEKRKYCWANTDKSISCFYKDFSKWFQDECLYVVRKPLS